MIKKSGIDVQFDLEIKETNIQAIIVANVMAQAIEDDIVRTEAHIDRYFEYVEIAELGLPLGYNVKLPKNQFRTRFSASINGHTVTAEIVGPTRHTAGGTEKAHINLLLKENYSAIVQFLPQFDSNNNLLAEFIDAYIEDVVVLLSHKVQRVSGLLHIIP